MITLVTLPKQTAVNVTAVLNEAFGIHALWCSNGRIGRTRARIRVRREDILRASKALPQAMAMVERFGKLK